MNRKIRDGPSRCQKLIVLMPLVDDGIKGSVDNSHHVVSLPLCRILIRLQLVVPIVCVSIGSGIMEDSLTQFG